MSYTPKVIFPTDAPYTDARYKIMFNENSMWPSNGTPVNTDAIAVYDTASRQNMTLHFRKDTYDLVYSVHKLGKKACSAKATFINDQGKTQTNCHRYSLSDDWFDYRMMYDENNAFIGHEYRIDGKNHDRFGIPDHFLSDFVDEQEFMVSLKHSLILPSNVTVTAEAAENMEMIFNYLNANIGKTLLPDRPPARR